MLLTAASAAHADVLELGADGARWVTGPMAGRPATGEAAGAPMAEAAAAPVMIEGVMLPDSVISDPARHAAGVPQRYSAKIAELAALDTDALNVLNTAQFAALSSTLAWFTHQTCVQKSL